MSTEDRNPRTLDIDQLDPLQLVERIHAEDRQAFEAVKPALPSIAAAVDGISQRLQAGGRLIYVGAGTSGRLGVLDAVECPPTFGVHESLVQGIIAGGYEACFRALEVAEDDAQAGQHDLMKRGLVPDDSVVGLSASGRTPYTLGAVRFARRLGALTVGISCNTRSPLSQASEIAIELPTGEEVITGSTRLKAGTAQKLVLNMLSTGCMIRLGNVYSNLMVNVKLSNRKLIERGIRIVAAAVGATHDDAQKALEEAGDVRSAIVMLELGCSADEARGLVAQSARLNEFLGRNQ